MPADLQVHSMQSRLESAHALQKDTLFSKFISSVAIAYYSKQVERAKIQRDRIL